MNKIYIVDAVNFLFRSYYAIGPMMNDQGESTNALYGFIRSVQKLIKDFSVQYLVCVFDGPDNKKSRRTVYADYKMHRKGAPEDLFPQFERAYEWCELAGIPTLCVEGVEADDAMAAVAVWAAKQGDNAYLCTSDKDLMQLVNERIFLIHAHKDNLLIDQAKVKELFGVRPDQMLDYLAIVGDASDNIPGLEGFGPKTACALLEQFGTLDNLLAHPEKVKGEKKQEILRTQQKEALMSRTLATLDTNVSVPKQASFFQLKERDTAKLSDFYHKMKFHSFLREMEKENYENLANGVGPNDRARLPGEPQKRNDFGERHCKIEASIASDSTERPIPEHAKGSEENRFGKAAAGPGRQLVWSQSGRTYEQGQRRIDKVHYHFVEEEKVAELLDKLAKAKEVCIDTDAADAPPMSACLTGIGFCIEPGEVWYISCNEKVLAALKPFFAQAPCSFYGHNVKYDLHVLENTGIRLKSVSFDTLIASYLLNPQSRRHDLDELMLERFQKIKTPTGTYIDCCENADYTARLKELLEEELKERKLERLFAELELPLLIILEKMERIGIYLDVGNLSELGLKLARDIEQLKEAIFATVGEPFNLNSPKQLSQILFEKLGMKPPTRKKTAFSTSADVLEDLAVDHPIVHQILEYRGLEKLRSTYVEALPLSIHPKTHRIHCTFSQSVAATGRLSSQDPNLQNIPVRTEKGLSIRACFKPQHPDWSYIGGDYSQIELRILAHFSEDPELLRAFRSGQDIHIHTASLVYDIHPALVTSEMRSAAKTVNFGIIYGQGPYGLSRQLRISMREASEFIKKYFERYPKVLDYLESCKAAARETGMATTLTGRQRPIPELSNQNPSIRSAAERLAINTPLQGTAADLIKMAMIGIDKEIQARKLKGNMILQIHDELIFEVPDTEIPIFENLVKEKMEQVLKLNVPIEVQLAVGKNWAEC